MKRLYQILKRPLLTEKTNMLKMEQRQAAFEVEMDATKTEIKTAVEKLFKVKVNAVNTSIVRGRWKTVGKYQGKTSKWKRAIVTLAEGQNIEFVEGV